MKSRLAKKLMTTPIDRLSPYWYIAVIVGDNRIDKALRMYNKLEWI